MFVVADRMKWIRTASNGLLIFSLLTNSLGLFRTQVNLKHWEENLRKSYLHLWWWQSIAQASLMTQVGKNPPANADMRHRFDPSVRKMPWRRKWQLTPVFLPRKYHGQRSLVYYSPCGLKESDMTEPLTLSLFHKVLLNFAQVEPVSRSFQYSLLILPIKQGSENSP